MRHKVKYAGLTDGSLTVQVPVDATGGMESRMLSEGDSVFSYSRMVTPSHGHDIAAVHGVIMEVNNGYLVPKATQPQVGDEVVAICAADDVSFISGSAGVILEDGSLRATCSGLLSWAMTQLPSQ